MKKEIEKELFELQEKYRIKILIAVESGSRAWGFESVDSDWDVRFIYIHALDWYLKIDDQSDNIEQILPNDIDLAGWELKKALKLLRKSNPPMLEWLRSPIVYLEQFSTAKKLRTLSEQTFNPKSCMHHYLHMAEGNYRNYLKKDLVRVKKYFYVLRPILACEWIRERNEMIPMEFHKLIEAVPIDPTVKQEIMALLDRKVSGEELDVEPKIEILNEYLEEKLSFYSQFLNSVKTNDPLDTQSLDALFRETLDEAWSV